jgi:hypothetical protein
MNPVLYLQEKLAGLVDIGHGYLRDGNWERVDDVVEAMGRIETQELPRARAQTRAERQAMTAARRAAPDLEPVRWGDDLPGGFVEDPVVRRSLPASVLNGIDVQDQRGLVQAEWAAEDAMARQRTAAIEHWRSQVLEGRADPRVVPPDFDPTPDMVAVGKVTVEQVEGAIHQRMAEFHGVQLGEDAKLENAIRDYGEMCAAVFGPNGHQALRALLDGPEQVGGRLGRERGTA